MIDYSISFDQSTGVYVTLVTGLTSTSYTATTLTGGNTYKFRVTARNAVGSSLPSTIATILCAGVPDAPVLSNNAALTTDTQIALTWVEGTSNGGVAIQDYRISFDQSTGVYIVLTTGVTTKSYIATGLTAGKTYSFKIESRN